MATTSVSAGQTVMGTSVTSGNELDILSGGVASSTSVQSGGLEVVSLGGLDVDAVLSGTLPNGVASQSVFGSATNTRVAFGGFQTVQSGGVASGTSISAAGRQTVSNGGLDISATVFNGDVSIFGSASATILNSGRVFVSAGGVALATTVNSGGRLSVQTGGSGFGTTVVSGLEEVLGGAASGTLVSGATASQQVAIGLDAVTTGTATGTTIVSGGIQAVGLGGTVTGTVVSNGGSQSIASGGSANGGSVLGGGQQSVSAGGMVSGVTLSSGLQFNFGTAVGTTISAGGFQQVQAGGVASNTFLSSGGLETILSGGNDVGATVAGDHQHVFGNTLSVTVTSGGAQWIDAGGVSMQTTVNLSGQQLVFDSGLARQTTVNSGGRQVVSSGGTAQDTVISGGSLELMIGAITSGGIDLSPVTAGLLQIDGTTMPTATISGLGAGDVIDLAGFAFGLDETATVSGGQLVLSSGGAAVATLNVAGLADGTTILVTSDTSTGGTDLTPLCFCAGTRIETEHGETPVEELAVGDLVKTRTGALKSIVWIGMGRHLVTPANRVARPVIVRRGALADEVPRRDLYLTHGHALYLDGILVPVENLINHRSIAWDEQARVVEYYHIELADHDVVLAEGAPAETYYDADNRALFQNSRPGSAAGEARPCYAPVLNGGPVVERLWQQLLARSGGRIDQDTTDEADLHLTVAGARLDPVSVDDDVYTFVLSQPAGGGKVRLCSRHGVPSLLGITAHDHRRLGVAIKAIELSAAGVTTVVRHDAAILQAGGGHRPEAGYAWTDGVLELADRLFAHLGGPVTLTVRIERPGMRYPRGMPLVKVA